MNTIQVKRGDAFTFTVNVKNSDGTAVNITGATLFFVVRDERTPTNTDDTDALITKTVTSHTTPASGISAISLTSTDTNQTPGTYYREIQVKFSNNDIMSASTGKFVVLYDLNKRTS